MDQTLRQLGELLLGAVSTVILLALLYVLYTVIVHKPLQRVLEERRGRPCAHHASSRILPRAGEERAHGEWLDDPPARLGDRKSVV